MIIPDYQLLQYKSIQTNNNNATVTITEITFSPQSDGGCEQYLYVFCTVLLPHD